MMSENVIHVDFKVNRGLRKFVKNFKCLLDRDKRQKNKKLREEKKKRKNLAKAYMKKGS